MPRRRPEPRKRRTREHVVADLAAHFVEGFVVRCNFVCEPVWHDYGYDLVMYTFDDDGFAEDGHVLIQLKASETSTVSGGNVLFDMDVRDYHRWANEPMPVFLVIYDVGARRGYWLYVQNYFQSDATRRPDAGARTIRVRVPERNRVGLPFVRYARQRKQDVLRQLHGKVDHHHE